MEIMNRMSIYQKIVPIYSGTFFCAILRETVAVVTEGWKIFTYFHLANFECR